MGNSVAHIPLRDLHLTPGNVLIDVYGQYRNEAQGKSGGEASAHHNLIRARVISVGPPYITSSPPNMGQSVNYFKTGDEVWVRGRRGYPINIGDGMRLFVINEWDVAIQLASPQASGTGDNDSNAPPPLTCSGYIGIRNIMNRLDINLEHWKVFAYTKKPAH